METRKIVFLWAHDRSLSTAFERAFIQREDYITFHESFAEPCYFGPERISGNHENRLHEHVEHLNTTYSEIIEMLLKAATNTENKKVFVKDMAIHVVRPNYKLHPENPTVLPIDFLKRCTHTFIIRTPEKSVPSFYRMYVKTNMDFILEDIGYSKMQVLFNFLTELTGFRPALVDANDLIAEPAAIMRMYCESGIDDLFEPTMLEWKAERVPAFDKWAGWHDDAQQSTGFNRIQTPKDNTEKIVLPDHVKQLIEESMPVYNTLYQFRLRV